MCAFLSFFFSCYAVKTGGSEGNGTALSFPERSRSQLSGFHRTLCLSPAPTRSNFPGSCRPPTAAKIAARAARAAGDSPEGVGVGHRRRLAGNMAHFPLNPSAASDPGTLRAHVVQSFPSTILQMGKVRQLNSRADLEPRILGPIQGSFHDFKFPNSGVCLPEGSFFFFS